MKKQWSMIGAILLFLGVAVLSVLNVEPVPVNFGFAVVEWPLIVIIFVSVLLGALIATLLSTYRAFTDQRKNKHKHTERLSGKKTRSNKHELDDKPKDDLDITSQSKNDDRL